MSTFIWYPWGHLQLLRIISSRENKQGSKVYSMYVLAHSEPSRVNKASFSWLMRHVFVSVRGLKKTKNSSLFMSYSTYKRYAARTTDCLVFGANCCDVCAIIAYMMVVAHTTSMRQQATNWIVTSVPGKNNPTLTPTPQPGRESSLGLCRIGPLLSLGSCLTSCTSPCVSQRRQTRENLLALWTSDA